MATADESNDTAHQKAKPIELQPLISWRHLGAAVALGLLSLVDQWYIGDDLTISGGPALIGLAAVVLLWPVVRQIVARGGEIDLKNLRLQVNAIENEAQRVESDSAMKIQELESELEDVRMQFEKRPEKESQKTAAESSAKGDDVSLLEWAVASYRGAAPRSQFRKRVEIDKEIIRLGRQLSVNALRGFLESKSWSLEAQMAVAVALGLTPPHDEEAKRARLLAALLHSRHERVRARSGQAAKRWGERHMTRKEFRSVLLSAVEERLFEESPTSGARAYLQKAREVLSATLEWGQA